MTGEESIWIQSTRGPDDEPVCEITWGPLQCYAPVADVRDTALDLMTAAAYAEMMMTLVTRVNLSAGIVSRFTTELLSGRGKRFFGAKTTLTLLPAGSTKRRRALVLLSRGSLKGEVSPDEARAMAPAMAGRRGGHRVRPARQRGAAGDHGADRRPGREAVRLPADAEGGLMGRQSKVKRKRRELSREHRAATRVLYDAAGAPDVQAWLASHHDAECVVLKERDRPGQAARLEAEGWVLREQNLDGLGMWDHRRWGLRIIHSVARELDGQVWAHVSVSTREGTMPTWLEVRNAGWVMYPARAGVIVVAPEPAHVSLAEVAHVWYRLTGGPVVPDFSHAIGSI